MTARSQTADENSIATQSINLKEAGYLALATVMGPFSGLGMYKRSTTSKAHSLLIRRAELLHLESELCICIRAGRQTAFTYHENVFDLIKSAHSEDLGDEQRKLILDICAKLEAYSMPKNLIAHAKCPSSED